MNYKHIYDQIIEKRQKEILYKLPKTDPQYQYCEQHHIIPKSLGGKNNKTNVINLTFREHYICHLLLVFHYRSIGDKKSFYKMCKALKSFENLKYGTIRNGIFFATKLFKSLTRGYTMPISTRKKLSKAKIGKGWSKAQREEWENRRKYEIEHGIKRIPWNKGIPCSKLTIKRMKRTIKKQGGSKNLGKPATRESKIKQCYAILSHKYPIIDWSKFDFETYINIPRTACIKTKTCKRLYLRHQMIANYIKQQVSEDEYLKMKDDYNKTHVNGMLNKKHKKKSRKKLFISRHKHFFPNVNWDEFDFNVYEALPKKKHSQFIKAFMQIHQI